MTSEKASTRVTAVMKILLTRLQESSDTTVLSEVQEMTGEASCPIQGQRRLDHAGYAQTLILPPHLI